MQAGNGQRRLAHVDPCHGSATLSHCFAENSATAADVQDLFAGQRNVLINPVDPERIDFVERFELAFAVPPPMGEGFEFGDFGVVDVAHGLFHLEA